MPNTLLVRHRIPVTDDRSSMVVFHHWMPTAAEDQVTFEEAPFKTTLSFDEDSEGGMRRIPPDEIQHWVNVVASNAIIDVEVANVADDLAQFIGDEHESPRGIHHGFAPGQPGYDELARRYLELGVEVQKRAMMMLNQLLSFARNDKGQYWLERIPFDPDSVSSRNVQCAAQVRCEAFEWRRWCPPARDIITIENEGPTRYIAREDWHRFREHVISRARSPLVLELLANAETLARLGRNRSAIIEAVIALELAVTAFMESPRVDQIAPVARTRIDLTHLGRQAEHLGFTATVRYLLPLVVSESQVPTSTLETIFEAIRVRGALVHTNQRDVSAERVKPFVRAIREVCERLASLTQT